MKIPATVLGVALLLGGTMASARADVAPVTPIVPKADAKGDARKEQAIRKLLQLTRASQMAMQMMDQMAGQLRPMFPSVPDKFWTDFFKEAKPDDLVNRIVPIYGKHLSEAEINELIKFYESPIGKKLVSVQPLIMQESAAVGQVWGRELGERVVKRLQEQGLLDGKGAAKK